MVNHNINNKIKSMKLEQRLYGCGCKGGKKNVATTTTTITTTTPNQPTQTVQVPTVQPTGR